MVFVRGMRPVARALFTVVGTVCVALGVVGIFLPLLPTTPFLLLAAACYARGSRRLHDWLLGHRRFGPLVRAFQGGGGLPWRAKAYTLALMWPSVLLSAYLTGTLYAAVTLGAIATGVTVYLLRLPTQPGGSAAEVRD